MVGRPDESSFRLAAIAAVAENRVIGRAGDLPWRLPADLGHFMRTTTGHHLLMGRRTYESTGPLPGRSTVVVTRRELDLPDGVIAAASPADAVEIARRAGDPEPMVCGGAEIYAALLPRVDRFYLTVVHARPPGDTFLPDWPRDEWRETSRRLRPADARHAFAMTFLVLDRRR